MSDTPGKGGSSALHAVMASRRVGIPGSVEKPKDPRHALRRLLPYLRPFGRAIVAVLVFVMIYTLLGLWGPYLMGVAIDGFIATKNAGGLARISLLLLAIYILNIVFQAVSGWIMAAVSQKALKGLRGELFEHLQGLPLRFFDRNPAGELMSRLTNDIDAINQAVSQNVVNLLASVLTMAGILIAMFVLNAWLALSAILVIPLLAWFAQHVARYTRKGYRELQKCLGDLNGTMEESISGQRVVNAFRRNDSVIAAFRRHNQTVFKAGVYANTYALMLMPLSNVLGNFFVIVLAGFGGWLALRGLATVGVIAAFIMYGQNFLQPLRQMANIYNSIQGALAGAERVFEIIDTERETEAPQALPLNTLRGDVHFEHVRFGYEPDSPVIHDMTLEAKAGEIVALVGPTGAGKTTIINLLTRFYEIDDGTIRIDGRDIRAIRKDDLRRQLGLVLQDTFLFSDSVMENIRYGRLDATDAEVVHAAEIADADHFIRQLPQGYQTVLSERAGNLSQGQRQLLAIARAILADPGILILDEATSSVDTRTEARIQKSLLRLMKGRTSFVIAHRLSTIRDADHLLVVNHGRIIEQGTHTGLLAQKGFYFNLYMSQFKGQEI